MSSSTPGFGAHEPGNSFAVHTLAAALRDGVWRFGGTPNQNAHAWILGYTSSLAMAVWVGDKSGKQAIQDKTGANVWGAGLPASMYRVFMTAAHDALKLSPARFAPPAFVGNANPPGSVGR